VLPAGTLMVLIAAAGSFEFGIPWQTPDNFWVDICSSSCELTDISASWCWKSLLCETSDVRRNAAL